jgi:GLPGLI family protein
MKKPFILLPFITQPTFTKRGIIDYKVLPQKIDRNSPNQILQKFINTFNEQQYHFRLIFDHWISFFDAIDKPSKAVSVADLSFAYSLLNFCPQFLDAKKKTILEYKKDHYIKKNNYKNQWHFTNESKNIGAYKVFKAETQEVYNDNTKQERTRLVTAWYCPDLPYFFGPLGYFDLPGLILELHKSGHKFIAEEININPQEFNNLELPVSTI